MTDRPDPWERQAGESALAYQMFSHYRDDGAKRSLTNSARALGKSRPSLADWSKRYAWVLRAEAWDRDVDRQDRLTQNAERKRMHIRHGQTARLALQVVGKYLMGLNDDDARISVMTVGDAARLLDVAAKHERLALGEADSRVELTGPAGGPLEITALTSEERAARLAQLQHEITARLDDVGIVEGAELFAEPDTG